MSFFGRMQIRKAGNPHHDAQGLLCSAANAVEPHGKSLPNGKHHGNNAFAATMNKLQGLVGASVFKANYPEISQAVNESLKVHKGWSSTSKAQEIWADLKNSKSYALSQAMVPNVSSAKGNPVFTELTGALAQHELKPGYSPSASATTHTPPDGAMVPGVGQQQAASAPKVEDSDAYKKGAAAIDSWAKGFFKGGMSPAQKQAAVDVVKAKLAEVLPQKMGSYQKAGMVFLAAKANGNFHIGATSLPENSSLYKALAAQPLNVSASTTSSAVKPPAATLQATAMTPSAAQTAAAPATPATTLPAMAAGFHQAGTFHKLVGMMNGLTGPQGDLYKQNQNEVDKKLAAAFAKDLNASSYDKAHALWQAAKSSPMGKKMAGSPGGSGLFNKMQSLLTANEVAGASPSPSTAPPAYAPAAKPSGTGPYVLNSVESQALAAHVDELVAQSKLPLSDKEIGQLKDTVKEVYAKNQNYLPGASADIQIAAMKFLTPNEASTLGTMDWSAALGQVKGNKTDLAGALPVKGIGVNSHADLKSYEKGSNTHSSLGKDMVQRSLKSSEVDALKHYKGNDYTLINDGMRSGNFSSPTVKKWADNMLTASRAGKVPAGTILYRGISDFRVMGPKTGADLEALAANGSDVIDKAFMSCASMKSFSNSWGGSGKHAILLELRMTKETPGVHVALGKGTGHDGEYEVVLPDNVQFKAVGYRKEPFGGTMKHILVLETK